MPSPRQLFLPRSHPQPNHPCLCLTDWHLLLLHSRFCLHCITHLPSISFPPFQIAANLSAIRHLFSLNTALRADAPRHADGHANSLFLHIAPPVVSTPDAPPHHLHHLSVDHPALQHQLSHSLHHHHHHQPVHLQAATMAMPGHSPFNGPSSPPRAYNGMPLSAHANSFTTQAATLHSNNSLPTLLFTYLPSCSHP